MKSLKLAFVLFVTLVLCNSCDIVGVKQWVKVTMKNNSENSINMWIAIEEMPGTNNLVAPGGYREKTLMFERGEGEFQKSLEFTVYAGINEPAYLYQCSIDFWAKNNGKTIDFNIQYNSDGSFSQY